MTLKGYFSILSSLTGTSLCQCLQNVIWWGRGTTLMAAENKGPENRKLQLNFAWLKSFKRINMSDLQLKGLF